MAEKTTPSLSLKMGIIIILMMWGSFIALSTYEGGSIMRAYGFLNMIGFLAGPFILYILFKNKTD
ncbi:MAG TPA: hypothetical protein QF851_03105 [Flavobacteriales bacterium]|nr:hypothetical protein [Flavobacteriales bacterium]